MPRFMNSDKAYYYDDHDPLDLDDEDDLGWKDGINRKIAMVHAPDVWCEGHGTAEDFHYGTISRQKKVNNKIHRINTEDDYVNNGCKGKQPKTRFYSAKLNRYFEIAIGDL